MKFRFYNFIILILSFLLLNSCAETYRQKGWKCEKAGDKRTYSVLFKAIETVKGIVASKRVVIFNQKLTPVSWEDGRFCIVEQDSSPQGIQDSSPQGIYDSWVKPEYCYNWLKNYISKKRKEGFTCTGPKGIPNFRDEVRLQEAEPPFRRNSIPKTQPEETQPEETQAEETQAEETQPEETQAEETQSEEEGSSSFWGEGF